MKAFWDERYSHSEYAYGEQPNEFLKAQLENFPVGAILFPAEGEGRNSVYAARSGWQASAFDQSVEGQKKAIQLAEKNGVTIDYIVNSFQDLPYLPGQFDAVGLFYAHFPAENRRAFHRQLADFLRPGGVVLWSVEARWGWAASQDAPAGGLEAALGGDGVVSLPNHYVRTFDRADVERLVADAGLELLEAVPSHWVTDGPLEDLLNDAISVEELVAIEDRCRSHPVWGPLHRLWLVAARRPTSGSW